MTIYNYGGIYDYLERIHFPHGAANPDNISKPYYFYMEAQTPTYFSFILWHGEPEGWAARHNFPVIKILFIDTQPIVPTTAVGSASLEAAADRYVQTFDAGDPRDRLFYGRMNPQSKFFWKVLGMKYPKWITGLSGLAKSRPGDPNPPAGTYLRKAMTKYLTQWNADSSAYNAYSNAIPPRPDIWNPLATHSFAIPFPHPTAWEGGNFSILGRQIAREEAWFGPIPASAWLRILIIFTQSYAFTYGIGQLDDHSWDLSRFPPRRTNIPQREGGSPRQPSAITGNYNGRDFRQDFFETQFGLI